MTTQRELSISADNRLGKSTRMIMIE